MLWGGKMDRKSKMSSYIMREPTILAVNMAMDRFPYAKDPKRPETYSKYNEGWSDACDYILGMIEAENIEDVAPVVHGRWLKNERFKQKRRKCSECGFDSDFEFNFCPNCGARMDAEFI